LGAGLNLAARHPYYDNDPPGRHRLQNKALNKTDLRRYAARCCRGKKHTRKIYHTIPSSIGSVVRWGFLRDQLAAERLNRQGLFEPRAV
jgi:hypothetical protein